jgi:hypothetical protein
MPLLDRFCERASRTAKLLLAGSLLILLATLAPPAVAGPDPADRMLMHRNVNRGVSYLKLSAMGAASSTAPLAMRVVTRIDLDGDPLLNVRGNVYPIDLNGDGKYGFVHFNGYRFMRVFDAAGRKLWQIDNPAGRVHRDPLHRDTLAVLDADGDGDQDIVHCWLDGGRKMLLVQRGRDGAVLHKVALDGAPGDECQIAALRVAGRATPLVLVAHQNASGCPTAGNYIDTWGRTVAFDVDLNELWDRNTCYAGHYVYPVDENADGFAEKIFIGRHLYTPSGTRICSFDLGNTHADGVQVADLDPDQPGLEAVVVGAAGIKAVSVARNCAPLWSIPLGTIDNPQQMALARLDPASATPIIAVREKGTVDQATLFYLDGKGRILARLPGSALPRTIPLQNANLDGKTGSDELLIEYARVLDLSGNVRLGTEWYWNLRGSKLNQVPPPSGFDSWPPYPFAMDLDHDGRDEIITWSQSLIVVGKAQ